MTPGCLTALIGLLPWQTPPIPTCLCSNLPVPHANATRAPSDTAPPAIRAGAPRLQPCSKPSDGAVREGFDIIIFFPQRRFVEDSLRQGENSLPGLPAQHPGKFLRPSLE